MDPTEAWALLDKLTNYDTMYEIPFNTPVSGRGLYEVSPEVDSEVRAHVLADETNRLKRQVSSLKACQLCQSMNHTASACTNSKQVLAAESYRIERRIMLIMGTGTPIISTHQEHHHRYHIAIPATKIPPDHKGNRMRT